MNYLETQFAQLMRQAWPSVEQGSPQWLDIKNAYYGGALVTTGFFLAITTPDDIRRLKKELDAYGETVNLRSKIFRDITEAGK
jgi:hypothetical protein